VHEAALLAKMGNVKGSDKENRNRRQEIGNRKQETRVERTVGVRASFSRVPGVATSVFTPV
jgi:hypothetical protein